MICQSVLYYPLVVDLVMKDDLIPGQDAPPLAFLYIY